MLAIFLDTEATGLEVSRHHLIDLALKLIDVNSGREIGHYQSLVKISPTAWDLRDPSSIEINGYTWQEVSQGKEPATIRQEIITLFQSCGISRGKAFFLCQNPSFDRAYFSQIINTYDQEKLKWPYHWLDFASMYWALSVKKAIQEKKALPEEVSLSKNVIAALWGLPEEIHPHKAINGVQHLIQCYSKIVGFPTLISLPQ